MPHPLFEIFGTLDRPLIGLDLETTGPNPETDRIVEIALEQFSLDGSVKTWRSYVNPGISIPAAATVIHDITDAMVADAPRFSDLAANLIHGFTNVDVIGYHVRFDLRVLLAECRRVGQPCDGLFDGSRILDAARLWQLAEPRSLTDAVRRWTPEATPELDAHSALSDLTASTRVVAAQLRTVATLPRSLDALHAAQWPDAYDLAGKLKWNEAGDLCLTFGQHRGVPLKSVPASYLRWMVGAEFSSTVIDACRRALAKDPPRRVASTPSVTSEVF